MERPIVTLTEGQIQGTTLKSVLGQHYLAFRGIPFAQPPLGDLRFREPQAPRQWSGIRDASQYSGTWPMQKETVGKPPFGVIGGEDCLYLNVYTNAIGYKRPVMFYIYGGGFIEGNGNNLYREDYFVSMDMVLVFVNYRLGPLGFLNLGHEVAPGNQGLRDIMFALQWVQRNIEAFGGDPNNVTIFGNSAGSLISHLFTMLPITQGLFHKAILQSGSMFMAPSVYRKNEFKNGFKIASLLGMDSEDPEKVIEFLRSVPAEKLVELEGKLISSKESMSHGVREYEPIYDAPYTKNPVIPVPLSELLKKKTNKPIIVGHTRNECLLFFLGKCDDEEYYKMYSENIENLVRTNLFLQDSAKHAEVMKFLRDYYLKDKPINRENAWSLIDLLSDLLIAVNEKLIDVRNDNGDTKTYVYMYTYDGDEPTFFSYDQGPQSLHGIAHADELSYMFYFKYMKLDRDEKDRCAKEGTKSRNVIERFIRMWYNFAATGNPTPRTDDRYITTVWKPSYKDHLYYLDIGEELTLRDRRDPLDPKGLLYEKIKSYLTWN